MVISWIHNTNKNIKKAYKQLNALTNDSKTERGFNKIKTIL